MANIRIQDIPQRIQYVATAPTQAVFPIPFPFLVNADIIAYREDVLMAQGGAPGQYTLTGAGTATGGTLTLVTPVVTGTIITIIGSTPIDRTSIYSPTISNLTGDDLNSDLNRIIIMLQELWTIQNYMQLVYKPWLELSQDITVTKDRYIPILPPLHTWMMNEANTEIIAAPLGGNGGGDALVIPIIQPNHGFARDQIVYHNGLLYALAVASNIPGAEVIGMVVNVTDADNFDLCVSGMVTTLMALVAGTVYFLSGVTPGLLTAVEPVTPGFVSKPLVIAVDADTGFFYNMRGKVINNAAFPWHPVNGGDNFMVGDNNYFTNGGGIANMILPVVCAVGAVIQVKGYGSAGWTIVQGAGQQIFFGDVTTTLGAAGTIESTDPNDDITLLCVEANTIFTVLGTPIGNLNVI